MGWLQGIKIYIFLFLFAVPCLGNIDFRTFTTSSGQGFTGKVVSYDGQIFWFQGRDGKLYPIPFKQLSANDQKYLIDAANGQKIPKGDARKHSSRR